jgi:hypothetical protein
MARLLIVTGPPGAGKSTVARLVVATFEPSVLVEGDAFFGFLRRGAIRPWLPAADRQNQVVTKAAAAASGRYASGGFTTVYDGVVGPWFLPTFANASGLPQLDYVILLPSVARCLEGVRTRSGHGFTDEEVTRQMHRSFREAEIERRHVLADPPRSPADTAGLVREAFDGGALAYGVGAG